MLRILFELALIFTVSATPLAKRKDIEHNAVIGFREMVPRTTEGTLMLKWQPYLYVEDGCVPFPAVDQDGNTSGGLAASGEPSGDCDSSPGQVYARAGSYRNAYAIMYSWYFPKDQPSPLSSLVGGGHRHDWEGVVVWLSHAAEDATLLGVATSYHGDYVTSTRPDLSGNHPLIKYYTASGILNHSMGFTSTVGVKQQLVAWSQLPAVARTALAGKDWGRAVVPFTDAKFEENLAEAVL